jgi:hypothetical protein
MPALDHHQRASEVAARVSRADSTGKLCGRSDASAREIRVRSRRSVAVERPIEQRVRDVARPCFVDPIREDGEHRR